MGIFPFGWIRSLGEDNWQLFWDSETDLLYAKGAVSKKVINIGKACSWQDAKILSDRVRKQPLIKPELDKDPEHLEGV